MNNIFPSFPDSSRVWIYQSHRPLTTEEATNIETKAKEFAQEWTSHNQQLKAGATVLYNHFIILIVDESRANVGGCSIDSSVHFLNSLEQEYRLRLFDRMNFAYQTDNGGVKAIDKEDFVKEYNSEIINDSTFVFNNLVKTKVELLTKWSLPLKDSWHKNFV